MPVVTFTYVDPEHRNLDRYIAHLRTYRPLFRQLPSFQFIYISTAAGLQKEAGELFSFLVEGKGLSDLTRYFDVQTKWDNRKYRLVTEDDMIFRHEAGKRFKARYSTLSSICGGETSCRMICGLNRHDHDEPAKSPVPSRHRARPGSGIRGQQRKDGVTAGRYAVLQVRLQFQSHPQPTADSSKNGGCVNETGDICTRTKH